MQLSQRTSRWKLSADADNFRRKVRTIISLILKEVTQCQNRKPLPITVWCRERERLEHEYKDIQTELSPLYADVKRLWAIHYNIYEVQHEQERQQTQLRSRKNEIEL